MMPISFKDRIAKMAPEGRTKLSGFVKQLVEDGADEFVTIKEPELPNMSDEKVVLVDNGQANEEEPQLPAILAPIAAKVYPFGGNVVFFGFGGVAECTMPILFRHLEVDLHKVTVIDKLDKTEVIKNWTDQGVKFVQQHIVEKNLEATLTKYLNAGDLLIDVAYDISCVELIRWCKNHEVMYINTSVEEWNYTDGFDKRSPLDKSLYKRNLEIDDEIATWKDNKGTGAILDMGANPGLITHFAKQGIVDLAKAKKKNVKLANKNAYAEIARDLGVKVILDTERDTQLCLKPKQVGEFVGTWSTLGLVEEATSPAELGWGTHEDTLPPNAVVPEEGPKNQIFISQMGMHTYVRGFVPVDPKMPPVEGMPKVEGYEIVGCLIRHGEAYTISKFFTTADGKYRPTVYYCYLPCDYTVASLREFASNNYCNDNERNPYMQRTVYENDIISGSDTLGAMIGGYDDDHVWWCGTSLNIEDARKLAPLQNATMIQVAIGLTAGIAWMLENPNCGVIASEDIDTDFLLNIAKPYLGTFISQEFEWSPKKNYINSYSERKDCDIDEKNLWGFQNFRLMNT